MKLLFTYNCHSNSSLFYIYSDFNIILLLRPQYKTSSMGCNHKELYSDAEKIKYVVFQKSVYSI